MKKILFIILVLAAAGGVLGQTDTATDSLFRIIDDLPAAQLSGMDDNTIPNTDYWNEHAYLWLEYTIAKVKQMDSLTMVSNNVWNALWFDSLAAAVDDFVANAPDTAIFYIPAGEYLISDSLNFEFWGPNQADWAIIGDPGGTVIKARSATKMDSTRNMVNIWTSGLSSDVDSTFNNFLIYGVTFDHNGGGGTRFYWANVNHDSCGHALRTYRYDGGSSVFQDFGPFHTGQSFYPRPQASFDLPESHGYMVRVLGTVYQMHIINCVFRNSNGGAIYNHGYRNGDNSGWGNAIEGGSITNCTFRFVRGVAISNLQNGPSSISNNYFRWVGVAYYASTGGWSFANNRVEEYDSSAVILSSANWMSVNNNIFSEGAGPAIVCHANCSGSIQGNTFINLMADNAHLGSGCSGDSLDAAIQFIGYFTNQTTGAGVWPHGISITNNYFQTHSASYDAPVQYFVYGLYRNVTGAGGIYETLTGGDPAMPDSCDGNIIANNIIGWGRTSRSEAVLGITNLPLSRNNVHDNFYVRSSKYNPYGLPTVYGNSRKSLVDLVASVGDSCEIVLPAGVYTIAESLVINNNAVTLRGVGKATVIRLADLSSPSSVIFARDKYRITIRDLRIQGRKYLQPADASNVTNNGVMLHGGFGHRIENVFFQDIKNAAVRLDSGAVTMERVVVENCEIDSCGYGIWYSYGASGHITNNHIRDTDNIAITLSGVSGTTITGNSIDETSDVGCYLSYSNANTIAGNSFGNTGKECIKLAASSRVAITGNRLDGAGSAANNTYSAINLVHDGTAGCKDNTIVANTYNDAGGGNKAKYLVEIEDNALNCDNVVGFNAGLENDFTVALDGTEYSYNYVITTDSTGKKFVYHAPAYHSFKIDGAEALALGGGFLAFGSGVFPVLQTKTPPASNSTGTAGQFAWDGSYLYICTATDTWERVAVAAW